MLASAFHLALEAGHPTGDIEEPLLTDAGQQLIGTSSRPGSRPDGSSPTGRRRRRAAPEPVASIARNIVAEDSAPGQHPAPSS